MLKILCLHGYRQDGESFKSKLGGFRKAVKSIAQLYFMNAPNIIREENAETPQTETRQRAWWFSKEQNSFCAQEVSDICKGFQESLDAVKQEFDSEGPFDGILGFSQGAAMVTLLCALKETQAFPYQFSFVFLIAAFQSNSKPHEALYCSTIQTPSLHVIGDTDLVIPKEMSETLLNCYLNPVVVQHPGGHYVPVSGQYKTRYLQFFQRHLKSNS